MQRNGIRRGRELRTHTHSRLGIKWTELQPARELQAAQATELEAARAAKAEVKKALAAAQAEFAAARQGFTELEETRKAADANEANSQAEPAGNAHASDMLDGAFTAEKCRYALDPTTANGRRGQADRGLEEPQWHAEDTPSSNPLRRRLHNDSKGPQRCRALRTDGSRCTAVRTHAHTHLRSRARAHAPTQPARAGGFCARHGARGQWVGAGYISPNAVPSYMLVRPAEQSPRRDESPSPGPMWSQGHARSARGRRWRTLDALEACFFEKTDMCVDARNICIWA